MQEHYIHTNTGYKLFKSSAKTWDAVVRYAKRLAGGEMLISVDGYVVD